MAEPDFSTQAKKDKFLKDLLEADMNRAKLIQESRKYILRAESEIINGLITARLHKHLTQAELAKLMGCTQATLSRIESEKSSPNLHTLAKMMEILDVGVALLKSSDIY